MLKTFKAIHSSGPRYLIFTVTARCNAFCDFCWNWENVDDAGKFAKEDTPVKRPELSLDEIKKVASGFNNLLNVNLCGGEPFLREDLPEIAKAFHRTSGTQNISVTTNGFLTKKVLKSVEAIVSENPELMLRVYVSIDGPEKIHNSTRKVKDGYKYLIETANQLVKLQQKHSNLFIGCNINFNSKSQAYIKSFLFDVMGWGLFDDINVDLIRGNPFKKELLDVDLELFEELKTILKGFKPPRKPTISPLYYAMGELGSELTLKSAHSTNREFACYGGSKMLTMDDIGNVFPCELLLEKKMGNIRDYNLDINQLLKTQNSNEIVQFVDAKNCNCTWECAINAGIVFNPKYYFTVFFKSLKKIVTG
jgi:MoaA/NifB/PqqE/SkfB family radical SAM enzyme